MSDTTMDPKAIAQAVAIEVADEDGQVGDFVEAIDLGDNVTDFRFETCIRGYEGWQWSVTLYRDAELDHWTVNESSLVPTDKALRPPEWIPWKDRLEPTDLAVTDSIGTDPDETDEIWLTASSFTQAPSLLHGDTVRRRKEHHITGPQVGRLRLHETQINATTQAREHVRNRNAGIPPGGDRLQFDIRMLCQQTQQLDPGITGSTHHTNLDHARPQIRK